MPHGSFVIAGMVKKLYRWRMAKLSVSSLVAFLGISLCGLTPARALGNVVPTANGLMTGRCVIQEPDGATVDGVTGTATIDGSPVAPVSMGSACSSAAGGGALPPGSDGNGWVEAEVANAQAGTNLVTKYNSLIVEFYVPPVPQTQDSENIFLFPSIESCHGGGSGCSHESGIVQPVLVWNWGESQPENWQITAMAGPDSSGNYHNGNVATVYPGDLLLGELILVAENTWLVYITDYDRTAVSSLDWTEANSDPWDWAQLGTLEAYTLWTEDQGGFTYCSELPNSGGEDFFLEEVTQWGPAWQTQTSVSESWYSFHNSGNEVPSGCGWGSNFFPGNSPQVGALYWNPHG